VSGHDLFGRRSAAEVEALEVEGWDVDAAAQSLIEALKAARLREESTPEQARELEWEISQVVLKLRTFRNSRFRHHVIELVAYTLAIGLRSALPEGRLSKLLNALRRSDGSKGGKKSAEIRRAKASDWQAYVVDARAKILATNPTLSQQDLADRISLGWVEQKFRKVGRSRLVQFLSQLAKSDDRRPVR
jgi:hypothetical protein